MDQQEFPAKGGYWRPPDADKYRIVEQDQPLWLVPKPGVAGIRLVRFWIARLICQRPSVWGGFGPICVFYRRHGTMKLKPYQTYMYHENIDFYPLIQQDDKCLSE